MLSQQEVADRAGTSLFTIQRIERGEGNVRPKTGRAVAAALGVPIEELLPKVQAPLWSDKPPAERRPSILADAITAAAEAWLAALSNPNITIQKRFGIRDAAIELFEQINGRVVRAWETLPIETRRDLVRAMAVLNEVPEECYRLMPEDTLQDSSDIRRAERRRKIREWTDRISA
jgi:transcriptional regulator with XRE-family HTH domain